MILIKNYVQKLWHEHKMQMEMKTCTVGRLKVFSNKCIDLSINETFLLQPRINYLVKRGENTLFIVMHSQEYGLPEVLTTTPKEQHPVRMIMTPETVWPLISKKIKESKINFQKFILLSCNGDLLARSLKYLLLADFPGTEICYFRPEKNVADMEYFQLPYDISVSVKNWELYNQLAKKLGEDNIPQENYNELFEVAATKIKIRKNFDELYTEENNEKIMPYSTKDEPAYLVTLDKENPEDKLNSRLTFIQYTTKIWKRQKLPSESEIEIYIETNQYKC